MTLCFCADAETVLELFERVHELFKLCGIHVVAVLVFRIVVLTHIFRPVHVSFDGEREELTIDLGMGSCLLYTSDAADE